TRTASAPWPRPSPTPSRRPRPPRTARDPSERDRGPARTAGSLARRTATGPANTLRHGDRCPADRSAPDRPRTRTALLRPALPPSARPASKSAACPRPGTGGGRRRGGGARGAAALSPGDITAHQRGSCTAASRLFPGPPGPAALSRSLFRGFPPAASRAEAAYRERRRRRQRGPAEKHGPTAAADGPGRAWLTWPAAPAVGRRGGRAGGGAWARAGPG